METTAGKLGFKSNGTPVEGGLGFTQVSSAAFWRISHRKAGVEVGEHVVGCLGVQDRHYGGLGFGGSGTGGEFRACPSSLKK